MQHFSVLLDRCITVVHINNSLCPRLGSMVVAMAPHSMAGLDETAAAMERHHLVVMEDTLSSSSSRAMAVNLLLNIGPVPISGCILLLVRSSI